MTVYLIPKPRAGATPMPRAVFTLGKGTVCHSWPRIKITQTLVMSRQRGQRGPCALNAVIRGGVFDAAQKKLMRFQSHGIDFEMSPVLQPPLPQARK